MADILDIRAEPVFDDRIVKMEIHTYNPYINMTLGHSDEIRIPIQQQDLYTLPCESFLYVEGRLTTKKTNQNTPTLGNNCVELIFDEARYELNGVEIDRCRNIGITSTLKLYSLSSLDNCRIMENAGFIPTQQNAASRLSPEGYFNFCVPLSMWFGFCADYKRVVVNARHELILIRARNDNNCLIGDPTMEPTLELIKVQWRMPHVTLNEVNKLSMLRALESGRFLNMSFHSWDLYEYPLLPNTTKHSWAIKTATQLEKPRYVIFAMQTKKKNVITAIKSHFNHCKLTNIKLYLNSEFFPYDDLNLDFEKFRIAVLHDMFTRFRTTYYQLDSPFRETVCDVAGFTAGYSTMAIIDCSRQNESIKSGTVDVRLEIEFKENVPENTVAYCIIIHDRVIEYSPLSNIVRKIM